MYRSDTFNSNLGAWCQKRFISGPSSNTAATIQDNHQLLFVAHCWSCCPYMEGIGTSSPFVDEGALNFIMYKYKSISTSAKF